MLDCLHELSFISITRHRSGEELRGLNQGNSKALTQQFILSDHTLAGDTMIALDDVCIRRLVLKS